MSVSDPLLKDLKGYILEIMKSNKKVISDHYSSLEFLCATIEMIFRKGLSFGQPSPFGITKRDYWSWIEDLINNTSLFDSAFKLSLQKQLDRPRVTTVQGRGRLFIRQALCSGCLHIPVEAMEKDSIIGNEILGEIFLSLVFQVSQITFNLQVENSAFLDETWQLPEYHVYELCPCLDLGIYLGHVKGWAVVLKVDEGSVAAEDRKVECGDVIDELFGVCIRGWRKGKIMSLFKQHKGLPIPIKVIKSRLKNGQVFPGLVPILRRLQIDTSYVKDSCSCDSSLSDADAEDAPSSPQIPLNGHHVEYLGSVEVGGLGDVTLIENAITTVLSRNQNSILVSMVTGEIGVQTVDRSSRKVLISHNYTEISSCGRRNDNPLIYSYIAGQKKYFLL
ncbi:hypothetical protein Avbf_07638 [Armadillidium vulgare]|nr:hypothetical protein Avbf_07638 [Armadillidium vulgare]